MKRFQLVTACLASALAALTVLAVSAGGHAGSTSSTPQEPALQVTTLSQYTDIDNVSMKLVDIGGKQFFATEGYYSHALTPASGN